MQTLDSIKPSAMRMWEWFDAWALFQEWRIGKGYHLTEDEDRADSDSMSPEEQHAHYHKHLSNIANDKSPIGSIGKESAKSAYEVLDTVHRSKEHSHKLRGAARSSREDDKQDLGPKARDSKEAQRLKRQSDEGEIGARMVTRHGHHQDDGDRSKLDRIHKDLDARAKLDKDPHPEHPLGYGSIANRHDATEDEVRRIARRKEAGTHLVPARQLARQLLKHHEKTGDHITHETVAKFTSKLIRSKGAHAKESAKSQADKAAQGKGSDLGRGKEDGDSTPGLEGISQSAGKLLSRVKGGSRKKARLHHPDSKHAQAGHSSLKDAGAHERIASELGQDPKSSIDVERAAKHLYKKRSGHEDPKVRRTASAAHIAKDLNHDHDSIDRILSGHEPKPTMGPTMGRRSGAREKRDAEPVKALLKKERDTKKSKTDSASDSVKADLHHLYPLTRGATRDMPPHAKTVDPRSASKPKAKETPEAFAKRKADVDAAMDKDERRHASPQKVAAGFLTAKGSPKHPGDFKEPKRKNSQSDEEHGAAVEAARAAHQAKVDAHHDSLSKSHEGVHKVVSSLLDRMNDPEHPVTKAYRGSEAEEKRTGELGEKGKARKAAKKRLGNEWKHHIQHAADDPELRAHLGVKNRGQFVSAMGNVTDRLEKHGTKSMASRIATGVPERRQSGKKSATKGGVEQDPERRKLPAPPHEGGPKAPGHGMDEPTSSAKRREKELRPAGKGPQSKELSDTGKAVLGRRQLAGLPKAGGDPATSPAAKAAQRAEPKTGKSNTRSPSAPWDARTALRGPKGAFNAQRRRLKVGKKLDQANAAAERDKRNAEKAKTKGLTPVAGVKPVAKTSPVTVGWKGAPPTNPTKAERKKGAQGKRQSDPIQVMRPKDPGVIGAEQAKQDVKMPKSDPKNRGQIVPRSSPKAKQPVKREPGTRGGPQSKNPDAALRVRPAARGTGSTVRKFSSGSASAGFGEKKPGVVVQPAKLGRKAPRVDVNLSPSSPGEKAAGSLFDRAAKGPKKPASAPAPMPKRTPMGANLRSRQAAPKAPKPRPISPPSNIFGADKKEESFFVRTALVVNESSTFFDRVHSF